MEVVTDTVSVVLLLAVAGLLVLTGLSKRPGLGVIGSVILIGLTMWLRDESFASLGFRQTPSWGAVILQGLVFGVVIQLISVAVFEPWSERIMGGAHDHSVVEAVKGSWLAFLQWMVMVWLLVAFLEEMIYRGFLLNELVRRLGSQPAMLALSVVLSSAVFGLSHSYQGRSGALSTGMVGVLLGTIFVLSDFNLWLAIFTHGFIDTLGIGLIAIDGDKYIRDRIWRSPN